jgi:radical SAM superfamily enzyme YgiQ (UPF0313 family)
MFEMDAKAVLEQAVADCEPECIGISVRNIDDQKSTSPRFLLDKVKEVVANCRELSNASIVLGGAGYSIFPESALAYLEADMGIVGEGEIAFIDLLARLEGGQDLDAVPGLYRRGIGLKSPRTLATSLDELPLPEPSILSSSTSKNKAPWIPVQTRRGCDLNCSYCSTPAIEGTVFRMRSPKRVAAWLENWVAAGYHDFYFVDNTFNLPPEYAKELCQRILDRELTMHWQAIIYPEQVDEELVSLMVAAGCRQVSLGFESGSASILRNLNKQFSPEDVQATSNLFVEHGIERFGFLLLGGPGETRETVEESLSFVDSLELNALRLTAGIRIYPNTPLADAAIRDGLIAPDDDLLRPQFYLTPKLDGWLTDRLQEWAASRSNVML